MPAFEEDEHTNSHSHVDLVVDHLVNVGSGYDDEDEEAYGEGTAEEEDDGADEMPLGEVVEAPVVTARVAIPNARRWVMLTDYYGEHCVIMSLDDDEERRNITSEQVENKGPVGLRRMVLEEVKDGTHYRETGEFLPATPELHLAMVSAFHQRERWNYDWPNLLIERDTAREGEVRAKLEAMMAQHPMPFKIIGLQRRFLQYFSDGDYKTQQTFLGLAAYPGKYPFTTKGLLRKDSRGTVGTWSSTERDKGKQPPGTGQPLLYAGPAWAVRFELDGQIPLFQHCVMYVDDEAEFLCSDWCQRHDFSTYGDGINLQLNVYSFDAWIMGPCLKNAMDKKVFTPKTASVTRMSVRDLLRGPVLDKTHLQALRAKLAVTALPLVVKAFVAEQPHLSRNDLIKALLTRLRQAVGAALPSEAVGALVGVYTNQIPYGPAPHVEIRTSLDLGHSSGAQYAILPVCEPCGEASGMCFRIPTKGGTTHHWHASTSHVSQQYVLFAHEHTKQAVEELVDAALLPQPLSTTSAAGPITVATLAAAEKAFQQLMKGAAQDFIHEGVPYTARRKQGYVELQRRGKGTAVQTVVKKNNGHVYFVDPATMETTLIHDEGFRAAAMFFFEMKDFEEVPFETLRAEAEAEVELAAAAAKAKVNEPPSFLSTTDTGLSASKVAFLPTSFQGGGIGVDLAADTFGEKKASFPLAELKEKSVIGKADWGGKGKADWGGK